MPAAKKRLSSSLKVGKGVFLWESACVEKHINRCIYTVDSCVESAGFLIHFFSKDGLRKMRGKGE